ncbi:MASE1 domain-containing sensor histidine kinase [Thalassotalea ganghwensis]
MKKGLTDYGSKALCIYIVYAVLWCLGWQLSVNFETIADITSWFLPAGIRVSALLFLPMRYWPVIAFSEFTSIFIVNSVDSPFQTTLGEIIGTFPPIMIYMYCVDQYLKSSKEVKLDSVQPVLNLFSWVGLGALLTASILVTSLVFQEQIPKEQLVTTVMSFMLGDFVGVLLVAPICYALAQVIQSKVKINYRYLSKVVLLSVLTIATATLVLLTQPSTGYYIKLLAFIPIVLFAYKHGWIGATASIVAVNSLIVVASFVTNDFGNMLEKQLYLIAMSMTGLLLGAAMSEQKMLNITLQDKNTALSKANDELLNQLKKNQQLAQKVVTIQEDERKVLSRELHDEIGQNITALKTNLSAVKQLSNSPSITPILDSINNIADATYSSAYNMMHWLRPRILDDLGFEKALTHDNFVQLLANAGINYIPTLNGNLDSINEDIKIAVYRITQECINNSVKHSKASNLWLDLSVNKANIKLRIKDDGIGFDTKEQKQGLGIQGIEDRVMALAGRYTLLSNEEGTEHFINFNVEQTNENNNHTLTN